MEDIVLAHVADSPDSSAALDFEVGRTGHLQRHTFFLNLGMEERNYESQIEAAAKEKRKEV